MEEEKRNWKQESPPAWTQEAYRPPCSKYSFCCPTRVPPPHQGLAWYPPGGGGWWVPRSGFPSSGPGWVPPYQDLAGGTLLGGGTQFRVRVPLCQDLARYPPTPPPPPHLDLTGWYPARGKPRSGYPPPVGYLPPGPGPGRVPPPPTQVWTDKRSETITSRLVLRTRSVIKHKIKYRKRKSVCSPRCRAMAVVTGNLIKRHTFFTLEKGKNYLSCLHGDQILIVICDPFSSGFTQENKKVLLRERKRHTTRHVSSIPSAVLSKGATPSLTRVHPILTWLGLVTHPWMEYPPNPDLAGGGGTPSLTRVTPSWPVQGVPHHWPGYNHPDLAEGYPIHGWAIRILLCQEGTRSLVTVPQFGPGLGTPCLNLARVPQPPSGPGQGTPQEGTWNQSLWYPQKGYGTSWSIMGWRRGSTLGVDRQTPVKTVPSRRTTYAGGNKNHSHLLG